MRDPVDAAIERLALRQHGLFTDIQARAHGATEKLVRHRLRTRRWTRVLPGVLGLLGADPTDPLVAVHASVLAAYRGVASHTTAAALLGVPGFRLCADDLHVTVPDHYRRRRTPARVHRTFCLPAHHIRVVQGIASTCIARTLGDLCKVLSEPRSARVIDTAVARRMTTLIALHRVHHEVRRRGRNGYGVLGRILAERPIGHVVPESELEQRFIELTVAYDLPAPERQVDLGDLDHWIGRVDFLYRSGKLVVEVNGAAWHTGPTAEAHDRERTRALTRAGFRVREFTWQDVTERPAWVAREIRAELRRAAA
jgi:hypothetical protein